MKNNMLVHYIDSFLSYNDIEYLDYYNKNTLDILNNYIYENVDTTYWSMSDMVRVTCEKYGSSYWEDNIGLYFWDGSKLILPFYNGVLNYYGSNEYEIDQKVNSFGFVPNCFQFIHDYEPSEPFANNGLLKSKVLFTNLSSYYNEICDCYTKHMVNGSVLSIADFYANNRRYILMFFGDMDNQIQEFLCNNRPYDFDIDGIFQEYDCGVNIYNIYDTKNSCDEDFYLFIHPKFLDVNFGNANNCNNFRQLCDNSTNKGNKSKGKKYHNKVIKKNNTNVERHKCKSVTNKGETCSRMAKSGLDFCGIHDNSVQVYQCTSVTAKGIQCGREVKNGYNCCSIHLRQYT
jgi:hypothetical protein